MTELRWWHQKDGKALGPFTFAELQQRAAAGTLDPDDLLSVEGSSDWFPARTRPELFPLWSLVAAHGRVVGRWSAGASAALLALYIAANRPQKTSDANFWASLVCLCWFAGWVGYWVGHWVGRVIGKNTEKADVARAVTTTATVAVSLLCLGMAAVYLSGVWREERAWNARIAAPPPEVRHRGRTAREWIAVYQKREPETWLESEEALRAIGTAECVAAFVRELETGDSGMMQLTAIQALEELALRGQHATRTALPVLGQIAAREPRPGAAPRAPVRDKAAAEAAARAIQTIRGLK